MKPSPLSPESDATSITGEKEFNKMRLQQVNQYSVLKNDILWGKNDQKQKIERTRRKNRMAFERCVAGKQKIIKIL